jgi:hypothetical protein
VTQFSLHSRGSQTVLSYFNAVTQNAWQRYDRFHARCDALSLHSPGHRFGNASVCFGPLPLVYYFWRKKKQLRGNLQIDYFRYGNHLKPQQNMF